MECCGNLSVIKDRINRIATEFQPQDPNLSIPRNDDTDEGCSLN